MKNPDRGPDGRVPEEQSNGEADEALRIARPYNDLRKVAEEDPSVAVEWYSVPSEAQSTDQDARDRRAARSE